MITSGSGRGVPVGRSRSIVLSAADRSTANAPLPGRESTTATSLSAGKLADQPLGHLLGRSSRVSFSWRYCMRGEVSMTITAATGAS